MRAKNIAADIPHSIVPSPPAPLTVPRPPMPWSLSFSTPIARTTSYTPEATPKQALRKASVAVAQRFSTRVTGIYSVLRAVAQGSGVLLAARPNQPAIVVDAAPAAERPEAHLDVQSDLYFFGDHVRHAEESPPPTREVDH